MNNNIAFFEQNDKTKGLPYALTLYEKFLKFNDILKPSLRDFHAIFWIVKGEGTYQVDFNEYEIIPGSLILLSKDQVHSFHSFKSEITEFHSITFTPDFLYQNENDLQHLFQFISTDHKLGQQILEIPKELKKNISDIFNKMENVYQHWDNTYQAKAFYHWLCLLLIRCEILKKEQKKITPQKPDENKRLAFEFQALLEKHFKTEFKVDFYLEQLQIPLKTLSKISHSAFKKSPKAFINERRVLEIKRQLKGTDKPIKSISYDLNFDEPTNRILSYLNDFKRLFGYVK